MQTIVPSGAPTGQVPPRAIEKNERKTLPYMTKFERARVLGTRAQQLSLGAPTTLQRTEKGGHLDSILLAEMEINRGVVPIIVRRYLSDGTYEDWSINEFQNFCAF